MISNGPYNIYIFTDVIFADYNQTLFYLELGICPPGSYFFNENMTSVCMACQKDEYSFPTDVESKCSQCPEGQDCASFENEDKPYLLIKSGRLKIRLKLFNSLRISTKSRVR